jgi:hypothetical protein|mmetsp:Transcript_26724/g.60430  ORF Transcript_26724/g.60430 Transcript_26724/m.60430 type:complete len:81 (+) Transcript_26724:183-425(+)
MGAILVVVVQGLAVVCVFVSLCAWVSVVTCGGFQCSWWLGEQAAVLDGAKICFQSPQSHPYRTPPQLPATGGSRSCPAKR